MPFTPINSILLQASEFTRFPHKFPPLKTIPLLPVLNPLGPRPIRLVDDTAAASFSGHRVCRRTKLAVAKPAASFPGGGAMAFTLLYPTKSSTRAPWSTSFFRHKFPATAVSF